MRQLMTILLFLSGLIGCALLVYDQLFKEPPPARVTVVGVTGAARGTLKSGDRVLMKDDVLEEHARVSTADGAELILKVDEGEEVVIQSDSQVELTSVSREGVDFTLSQGSIEASVKRFRGRKLSVGVPGNAARVQTGEGALRVITDGRGKLDVASLQGKVEVVTPGKPNQDVPSGQRRLVDVGGEVLLSGDIPRSVLLQVDWPTQTTLRQKSLPVTGRATPGSRVLVNGGEVLAGKDGRFQAEVPLSEGTNQVSVEARGMGDPARSTSPELLVDTTAPKLSIGGSGLPTRGR